MKKKSRRQKRSQSEWPKRLQDGRINCKSSKELSSVFYRYVTFSHIISIKKVRYYKLGNLNNNSYIPFVLFSFNFRYDCVLCKQQQYVSSVDTKSNVFVLLAFSIKSSALSQENGQTEEHKNIQPNHLPVRNTNLFLKTFAYLARKN